jgi:hypothetical protein
METLEKLSKEQIVAQLENDLKEKSIEDLMASTKHLKSQFHEADNAEVDAQLKTFEAEGGNKTDFSPEENPINHRFKELYNILQERKKEYKKELARLEEENYLAKIEVINQLRELTEAGNDNIGEAFKKFYELRDKWNEIGAVNQARYKQLQFDYSHLQDVFYYNISIHKELKNYDFKKNAELKEAIVEKLKSLQDLDSIRQLEHFIKEYQNEWDSIGPTTEEKWAQLKNNYWDLVNSVYEKIRLHYQNIREQQKEAQDKKEALLETTQHFVATIAENWKLKDWNTATEKIQEIQEEWKKAGLLRKSKNNALYESFKAHIDEFFAKKSDFFDNLKGEQKASEQKKKSLIEKANALKTSTDWAAATPKIIQLQEQWKKSGSTHPKTDQKLWKEFREACDYFFTAKKNYFDTLDDRLEENLKNKNAAIENIEKATTPEQLTAAVQQWHEAGFVPKKQITKSNTDFDKALAATAKKLSLSNIEDLVFEAKINAYKKAGNSKDLLQSEKRFVLGKIEKLRSEMSQYENNLSFFGPSKGAQKLKEAVENKMKQTAENLEKWEKKLKLLS